jgi:hypothetical protein
MYNASHAAKMKDAHPVCDRSATRKEREKEENMPVTRPTPQVSESKKRDA